ncbi:MAG: hypothetical protein M0Q94_16105, partial [Candidatus Cloacimonetes bacterium]|nr:hypothetical protein [Candidatus Cloacimonadota bacterium]
MNYLEIIETKINKTSDTTVYPFYYLSKLSIRLINEDIIEFQKNRNIILRAIGEDVPLFSEKRVGAVDEIFSSSIQILIASHKYLPCISEEMKSILGGDIKYFWQGNVNAILLRNGKACCFGKNAYFGVSGHLNRNYSDSIPETSGQCSGFIRTPC